MNAEPSTHTTLGILDARSTDAFAGAASFGLWHRVHRALWGMCWFFFARWTPTFFRRWRIALLKIFGADVAWTANVYSSVVIWYPPNLTMKHQAALGPGVICYCMAPVVLGERVVVSQRAHICTGTHDFDKVSFQLWAAPVHIEDNAWVAAEAYVGPGVTIGKGAVLGARSVATRDLMPWMVYAGVPARPLRRRDQTV